MPWPIIVLILVVLFVIVVATIFASASAEIKKQEELRKRPGAGPRPPSPPSNRPVSDLDRFLAEARKRRDSAEKKPPVPIPAPKPVLRVVEPPRVPARNRPPIERARPSKPARPAQPSPAPRRPTSQPVTVQPIPVFEIVSESAVPTQPDVPTPPQATPVNEVTISTAGQALDKSNERRMAPAFAEIVRLLGSPQRAASAAFLLGEIFNKPLSLRKRQGS